nr:hypothetical protein [Tanacetum cinerariifolium]
MSDQLLELKNTVKIKQMTISELNECLRKKDSENEHLKSKIVDFTTVQNLRAQVMELHSENEHLKSKVVDFTMIQTLQVQVEELKNVNESLNLSVEELSKAHALTEATLRERDEMISAQYEKMRLLEEQSESFYEVASCGWSFASAVLDPMTHLVTSLTPDSANSCVMQGASCTQRKVSMVLFVLPSILLVVVIVVTVVIVVVISVVVVGVVVVVVGSSVSSINKLSLVIVAYASRAATMLSATSCRMAA